MKKRNKNRVRLSWEQEKEALRNNPMERLRWKVLSRFGILPGEKRAKGMKDREILLCALHILLDAEEWQEGLHPSCCEENPAFDMARFEELKHRG